VTLWTPPQGRADVAPSRFARREGDGYLTLDAAWIVPALLSAVTVEGPVLEPAAGRGHLSLALKQAGLAVTSFDLRRYRDPLVPDIGVGDIRGLTSLKGFAWTITNLPYCDLEALAEWLIDLAARDRCATALLVRAEWIVPRARRALVHAHLHFAGVVMLTKRPRWVDKAEAQASPRHNFLWAVWGARPRSGDPWLRFAHREQGAIEEMVALRAQGATLRAISAAVAGRGLKLSHVGVAKVLKAEARREWGDRTAGVSRAAARSTVLRVVSGRGRFHSYTSGFVSFCSARLFR
jgi:hypothetical protein